MKKTRVSIPLYGILLIVHGFLSHSLLADGWELAKDKNDIKIYIRSTEGSRFKTYKGEAILNMSIQRAYEVLIDVENYDKWVYECPGSRLISKTDHKEYTFYSEIKMPWPFDNRDMVIKLMVANDMDTIFLATRLADGIIAPVEGLIRVPAYDEVTTLIPMSDGNTKMIMEGYFEPGGTLPAWLVNLFITDGPYESIMKLKELFEKDSNAANE